jgi:tetratricopeptide (TPR) repeat protein
LWYRNWANALNIHHLTLTETKPIRILGMIVQPDSSDPGLLGARPVPVSADHVAICKPFDKSSEVYVYLRAFVERTVERPRTGGKRRQTVQPPTEGRAHTAQHEKRIAPKTFHGVPLRIAGFTGRNEALDRLHAILTPGNPAFVTKAVGRVVVQGLGGVGKTSLAAEYAHRYREQYAGVWWSSAENRTSLLGSLTSLAVALGAASPREANIEQVARVGLRRISEQTGTWLLIYDNVPSPDVIDDLLPTAGARLLMTSRFLDWGGWADELPLNVLAPEDAATFLQERAGRVDQVGARTLADALGLLPLALDHAGAACRRSQVSFSDFAGKVEKLLAEVPRGSSYPRSVAATFNFAIAEAVEQCPAAEPLMAYLAQCAPERIPIKLVEGAVRDVTPRLQALTALTEMSLIQRDSFDDGTPAVTVHRLVQVIARSRLEATNPEREIDGPLTQTERQKLLSQLSVIFPDDGFSNPNSWPLCEKLIPHVLTRWTFDVRGASADPVWPDLLNRAGSYLHGRGSFAQAVPLFRSALEIRQARYGGDDPRTLQSVNNLALAIRDQGDTVAARPLFERALASAEQVYGPGHAYTAAHLNNLGILLRDQGDFAEARVLFERALVICEETSDPAHPAVAVCLNNIGLVLRATGDRAGAQPFFERALAIREASGRDHPDTADFLNNLARQSQDKGDFAGAQSLFQRALAILEKEFGSEHPDTNRVRCNLATMLLSAGNATEAWARGEGALAAHNKILGPAHAQTMRSARVTADALDALGRADEAAVLRKRYGLTVPEKAEPK